jgi:flagellar M-ring protein FliF
MADEGKEAEQGIGPRALAVLGRGQKQFQEMPQRKRAWLLGGVGLLAAVTALLIWYSGRPEWKVLFSGLEARDAEMVTQELGAAGVRFRTVADGTTIEVPAELLDKARLEVAAKGMPQTGRLGFELFDKPNWVGSEFDEKVNYQRALEGELEHTIGSLTAVRSARVHLVLPEKSLFQQEERPAKASVVLKLKRMELAPEQTETIRRLVAGAVENLSPENVTLADADGRQNLQVKNAHVLEADAEAALEAKLTMMLEPTVGAGNVRAVVNTSYDEGDEEHTDEVYDPALSVTLTSERGEQMSGLAPRASGVPGTASNTPAAAAPGAVQGSAAAAAPGVPPLLQSGGAGLPVYPDRGFGQTQTIKQDNETYGVTRHVVHREDTPGRVKRVTVAVLVNDRMTMEGSGKTQHTVWKPRSAEEMHRLEQLAQAAAGYDAKRGDQVTVENVSFSSNGTEVTPVGVAKVVDEAKEIAHTEPGLVKLALTGFIAMLIVLLVMRPVAKQVMVALQPPPPELPAPAEASLDAAVVAGALASGSTREGELSAEEQEQQHQFAIERVAEYIRQKPAQSTRLLETWIDGPQEVS